MGQEEVLSKVEELGFTYLQELNEQLKNLSTPSIIRSLSSLTKFNEIEIIVFDKWRRRVYLSKKFIEEIQI